MRAAVPKGPRRYARGYVAALTRARARDFSTSKEPLTPDFNTTVNVADIKLSKPKTRVKAGGAWEGLQGLEERTQGSLIDDTLKKMKSDVEYQFTAKRLKEVGQKKMTLEERKQRRRALDNLGVPEFWTFLEKKGVAKDLHRIPAQIFQLNIGLYCNQACNHCHVDSSPKRTEMMDRKIADRCLHILQNSPSVNTLDLTGGAPEMNSEFRYLVTETRKSIPHVKDIIDRCNLTVLSEPGQEDLAEFLAENKVRVVASLPCYSAKNVNQQRGKGVFDRSIKGLRILNSYGYGKEGSGLSLDLVYNPLGAFLPPPQGALTEKYKEELLDNFGIEFNELLTITNMPIKRFADFLYRRNELQEYMNLLVNNFNGGTVGGLMCKNTVSVSWDGQVYDCDFNQQLGMGAGTYIPEGASTEKAVYAKPGSQSISIFDFDSTDALTNTDIVTDSHCFGCTAGAGSSCQGATV